MKMLLVGELNETLYSLNEYLTGDFQTQVCSNSSENVNDMIRLYRPSIVVCLIGDMDEDTEAVLRCLSIQYNSMPALFISTAELHDEIVERISDIQTKSVMTRPVLSSDVRKEAFWLLNLKVENSEKAAEEPEKKEKKRILVVDDNALFLRKVKTLLERDYKLVLANSGEKALAAVKKSKVDLILLDYEMPGMNGREVFEKLIEDEETKDIPVVFLTSVSERDKIYAVLQNVPFGYILKPPANEKILSVIKEALE